MPQANKQARKIEKYHSTQYDRAPQDKRNSVYAVSAVRA